MLFGPTLGTMKMAEPRSETVRATVVGQSRQVRHVVAKADGGELLAATPRTFHGEWALLRRGDVLQVVKTSEPLPKVLHARLLPAGEN